MRGAVVWDRRAKAWRPCLACSKPFKTTIAKRICPACSTAVADAQRGAIGGAALRLGRVDRDQ